MTEPLPGPLLAVERLTKRFGSLVVSDAISLDFAQGGLHALIGPNGAGKTTFIHQLSGLIPSDAGRIRFNGEDVTRLDMAARARKGLVRSFQITSVLPAFSALENVALAAQARAGSSFRFLAPAAREEALNATAFAALRRVGLERRADVRAGSLSHGEKRLLEIAIALATGPKLLVLDEPLAGLGQDESQASIRLLAELKAELTIILVEHDMDAVFALADRVSVLTYGRVIATGSPADIQANAAVREAYLGEEAAA
jgi:branched-chain amino acid transport system ATP-binding protein